MPTAIISGASRGIGRAAALHFLKKGWCVHTLSRTMETGLSATLAEHGLESSMLREHAVSVADEAAVSRVVAAVSDEAESLDLVFSNAGIHVHGTLEPSAEELQELFAVNLHGARNLAVAVVPILKRQGRGALVHTASIAGLHGFAGVGAYCASKFALRGLNESLFNELAPHGISVTALCPSWVNTEMALHGPMLEGEMIQPEDICRALDFILSLSPGACLKEIVIQCRSDLQ